MESPVLNRKPKLHEGESGKTDVNDIDADKMKLAEQLLYGKNKWYAPSFELFLAIPVVVGSAFAFTYIPGYVPPQFLASLSRAEQPICATIDQSYHDISRFGIPALAALILYYLAKLRGDIIVSAIFALMICFDDGIIGLFDSSPSVAVMAVLLVLSFSIIRKVLDVDVYTLKWFMCFIFAAVFSGAAVFVRPESTGSVVAVGIIVLISALTEVFGAIGNRVKVFIQIVKMIFCLYLIGIPAAFLVYKAREKFGACQFLYESILWSDAKRMLFSCDNVGVWGVIGGGIIMFKIAKYRYLWVVPILGHIIGVLACFWLPLESRGNAGVIRMFFAKLNMYLTSGIIVSHIPQSMDLVKYGLSLGCFIVAAGSKLGDIAEKISSGDIQID